LTTSMRSADASPIRFWLDMPSKRRDRMIF
jgi:hypothetical protein